MDAERLARVAAMARSIALSGERWSDQAEAEYRAALAAPAVTETDLRAAVESAIRLAEVIPHSADVEQAGLQAEVVIETLRAALAGSTDTEEGA